MVWVVELLGFGGFGCHWTRASLRTGNGPAGPGAAKLDTADALKEALPNVPENDALGHKARAYPMPTAMAQMLHDMPSPNKSAPDQYVRDVEWFCGQRKRVLSDCITFCHMGGYSIWM
jgi:hypothetical protein